MHPMSSVETSTILMLLVFEDMLRKAGTKIERKKDGNYNGFGSIDFNHANSTCN